jgi:hypothetical protein
LAGLPVLGGFLLRGLYSAGAQLAGLPVLGGFLLRELYLVGLSGLIVDADECLT